MTKRHWQLEEIVAAARQVLEGIRVSYAIGGGVAVQAHGHSRATKDVDVFLHDEDRGRVLRAFRDAGFDVSPVMAPFHYIALPPDETDIRRRVDLMFPAGDPEISAIEMAQEVTFEGEPLKVFPAELLIIAKFYGERAVDKVDIAELMDIGAFDLQKARKLLHHMDPDALPEFDALIESLKSPTRPPRQRPRRK